METSASLLERLRDAPTSSIWQRMVDIYTPLLRGWLGRHQLQSPDQDDLIQEVMTVVVAEIPKFHYDPQRGTFRGWLRTILANRLRAFWRGHRRTPTPAEDTFEELLEQLADPQSEVTSGFNDLYDEIVLKRLLEQIKPEFEEKTWQAFHRVALDEANPAAVAEELGMSVGAVYIAKSRVMRRLQQEKKGLLD